MDDFAQMLNRAAAQGRGRAGQVGKGSGAAGRHPGSAQQDEQLGRHPRELNPYWANGGLGVPSARPTVEVQKPQHPRTPAPGPAAPSAVDSGVGADTGDDDDLLLAEGLHEESGSWRATVTTGKETAADFASVRTPGFGSISSSRAQPTPQPDSSSSASGTSSGFGGFGSIKSSGTRTSSGGGGFGFIRSSGLGGTAMTDADKDVQRAVAAANAASEGRFSYMGKTQRGVIDDDDGGKGKKRQKIVNFEEEEGNYSIEDLQLDIKREQAGGLIDYKKMNAERLKKDCRFCLGESACDNKFVISSSNQAYLALPRDPLTPGHCLIATVQHRGHPRDVEKDEETEIRNFKKCLIRMFEGSDQVPVFILTCTQVYKMRHIFIECVPLSNEEFDDAELSFRHELNNAEDEFARSNKGVVRLQKGKPLGDQIPKDFPVFVVEFGLDDGFIYVIEDESKFRNNFGHHVLSGLLGQEIWPSGRRGKRATGVSTAQQENQNIERIKQFKRQWMDYDWTANLRDEQ